jgi:glycosyltransferase involved in cell wall biosynthesis
VKNYAMFVDVIDLFLKKSPAKNIQFVIIGDGQTRKEIQLKLANQQIKYNYFPENKNATDSTVIFTSWQAEMDMVFAGLDIVCLTSLNEGTPTSLIEAQAASLPIVSTNVGGVADTVIENQTAFLTAPNDVNDFVAKLEILVNSVTKRKEMGEKGFVFVNEKYNHKRFINDTVNLYQDLYSNNKG